MSGNHRQNLLKILASLLGIASTSSLLSLPVLALPNSSNQVPASGKMYTETKQPIDTFIPGTQQYPKEGNIRTQGLPNDRTIRTQQYPPDTTTPGTQQYPPDTTTPGMQPDTGIYNRRERQNTGQGVRGLW